MKKCYCGKELKTWGMIKNESELKELLLKEGNTDICYNCSVKRGNEYHIEFSELSESEEDIVTYDNLLNYIEENYNTQEQEKFFKNEYIDLTKCWEVLVGIESELF